MLEAEEVDTVIFDDELRPGQMRALERALGSKVGLCDRTALILDIFSQRAASKEGQLQVRSVQIRAIEIGLKACPLGHETLNTVFYRTPPPLRPLLPHPVCCMVLATSKESATAFEARHGLSERLNSGLRFWKGCNRHCMSEIVLIDNIF